MGSEPTAAHGRQETRGRPAWSALVEHGDLDGGRSALADEVPEPAGAGEHDVDAATQAPGPAGSGRRRQKTVRVLRPAAPARGRRGLLTRADHLRFRPLFVDLGVPRTRRGALARGVTHHADPGGPPSRLLLAGRDVLGGPRPAFHAFPLPLATRLAAQGGRPQPRRPRALVRRRPVSWSGQIEVPRPWPTRPHLHRLRRRRPEPAGPGPVAASTSCSPPSPARTSSARALRPGASRSLCSTESLARLPGAAGQAAG